MHARLITLEDMSRASRANARTRSARRDANLSDFDQWRLREYVKALVTTYGYREDYRGKSTPWRVPYIPMPFAGEMVHYFRTRADYWLKASVPEEAKQPNFIKNWTARAVEIVGKVDRGRVITPNATSYEDAPGAVAAKAPAMFRAEFPAGQPHAKVLKADASWRLLDALSGQPTKMEIFEEAVKEQVAEVGEAVGDAAGKVMGMGKGALKWLAIAAVGLGALYVVTR